MGSLRFLASLRDAEPLAGLSPGAAAPLIPGYVLTAPAGVFFSRNFGDFSHKESLPTEILMPAKDPETVIESLGRISSECGANPPLPIKPRKAGFPRHSQAFHPKNKSQGSQAKKT